MASLLLIVVAAVFKYAFAAQLTQVKLSAKPIEDTARYGLLGINLKKMATTLINQANKKPGYVKLPSDLMILNYLDEHARKMQITYGLTTEGAAIFVPASIVNSHVKELTKQEIAPLLMLEIIKIRNAHTRRGFRNTIWNVSCALINLLNV